MDKRYVIFDMDGTLVDSMRYWKGLAKEYLEKCGVPDVPADIRERIKPMTMEESAQLFIDTFEQVKGTCEEVVSEMNAMMDDHYRLHISLKKGVKQYVEKLAEDGVRMCVASATEIGLMDSCLERLGIRKYFDFLLSCETDGIGKDRPDIYLAAAERFDAAPGDIAVFEDAAYAARTAKDAGFHLVGVYDESTSERWEKVRAIADETVIDFTHLLSE